MESISPTSVSDEQQNSSSAPIYQGRVEFTGNGRDYFGIWIVNILLSVVTLGIYSAWAKVRTYRYFYGHTRINGHSFDYLATPIQILKGRILAFAFFVAYTIAVSFFPLLGMLFIFILLFLMPWLINQGLRFNLRMTRHRNVRFSFDGNYGDAFLNFIVLPFASVFTFYLLMPYVFKRIDSYMHSNISYGDKPLNVNLEGATYYIATLMCSVASIIVVLAFIAIGAIGFNVESLQEPAMQTVSGIFFVLVYVIMLTVVSAVYKCVIRNHIFDNSQFDDVASFKSELKPIAYAVLLLTNILAIVFTAGFAYPWTKVRTAKMLANVTTVTIYPQAESLIDTQQDKQSSFAEEAANVFDIDLSLT